jgi:hypothetical protein
MLRPAAMCCQTGWWLAWAVPKPENLARCKTLYVSGLQFDLQLSRGAGWRLTDKAHLSGVKMQPLGKG